MIKKLSISPGDVVVSNGNKYELITATADILGASHGSISLRGLTYHFENLLTGEIVPIPKRNLSKFVEEVIPWRK